MSEQILIVEDNKDQCYWFKKKVEEKFKDIKVFECNEQKQKAVLREKGGTVKNVPGFISVKEKFLI